MKCDNCVHNEVCLYSSHFHDLIEQIHDKLVIPNMFSVVLDCKYFKNIYPFNLNGTISNDLINRGITYGAINEPYCESNNSGNKYEIEGSSKASMEVYN